MRNLKLISALVLLLPCSLHAQQTIPDNQKDAPAENVQQVEKLDSTIRGEWSEPKNGIRMMAKFLQADEPNNNIHLLVFAQNCSNKPIAVPGFTTVSTLQIGDSQPRGGNLLVTAKPVDRRPARKADSILQQGDRLSELNENIQPGEIRIHAVCLKLGHNEMLAEMLAEQNPNAIQMDSVYGPPLSNGRWRFSVSWRPDEQFPIPAQQPEGQQQGEERAMVRVDEAWQDVQIDLPPFKLDWQPPEDGRDQ